MLSRSRRRLLIPETLMHRIPLIITLSALALPIVASATGEDKKAEKPLKSGLQVGEIIGTFDVEDVTGPARGREICYACRYGSRPVVNIFVREITDEVTTLITKLDKEIGKNQEKQLKAFVVLLSEDPKADEELLIKVTRKHRIRNVPLTLFDGEIGPPKCRISEKAAVTVMLWHDSEVKANHAFAKGEFDKKSIEAVVKSTAKILK